MQDPRNDHASDAVVLREPAPGDLAFVAHRQALLYWKEQGWGREFEAALLGICARFLERQDPARERAWIAESNGRIVGAVLVVAAAPRRAQLRMLHVEADARGEGIGARLVAACVDFASRSGYEEIVLWTDAVLEPARRLYVKAGFECVSSEPHPEFGPGRVAQFWRRAL